jgi:hypothetical protein
MLSVEDWAEIRRLHRAERLPIKVIARVLGISKNTASAPGLGGLQGESFEVCLAGMLSAFCTFGWRQLAVGVDELLELIEHGFSCIGCPRRWVLSSGPRFVGGDLSA